MSRQAFLAVPLTILALSLPSCREADPSQPPAPKPIFAPPKSEPQDTRPTGFEADDARRKEFEADAVKAEAALKAQALPKDPKSDHGPQPEEPVKVYGPVPSLVVPGKVGAAAYDAYPEPWRSQFVDAWKRKLSKAQDVLAAAERKLADAERAYVRDQNVSLPNGRRLNMDRNAIDAAKRAVEVERQRVAPIERNDPPLFLSKIEKEAAEYAALPAEERAGREAAAARLAKWRAAEEEKERARQRADKERADREKKRKEEEELDTGGLVLMKKTVKTERSSFGLVITGTVVNRLKVNLRRVQIIFNLYDENDGRVGTTRDVITDLEPGGKWTFRAVSLERDARKYKLVRLEGDE